MSAARLILRLVVGSVAVLMVGLILVFGFTLIEPFSQAFSAPASLNWDSPGSTVVMWAAIAGIAFLGFIIIWLITAPIREDRRQQFGR